MGVKPEIEFIDMPENIMNQYQYYSKAEMEKLISAGYNKPCMMLEDSIKDYVQEYIMTEKYLTVWNWKAKPRIDTKSQRHKEKQNQR